MRLRTRHQGERVPGEKPGNFVAQGSVVLHVYFLVCRAIQQATPFGVKPPGKQTRRSWGRGVQREQLQAFKLLQVHLIKNIYVCYLPRYMYECPLQYRCRWKGCVCLRALDLVRDDALPLAGSVPVPLEVFSLQSWRVIQLTDPGAGQGRSSPPFPGSRPSSTPSPTPYSRDGCIQ